MNGTQQDAILAHLNTSVFNTELASCDVDDGEYLSISADYLGRLEFMVNKDGLTASSLASSWTSHKDDCSDCVGWSL